MSFNLEYKITYDELSPSLQALFKDLQQQITNNKNSIEDLENRISNLENNNSEMFVDGSQGQFVKIDIVNHSLYGHDGFLRLRCVDNDKELQDEMKNIPLTLEEVFNSWYRYAHYNKAATDRLDYTNAPDNVPQGQNLNHTEYNIYTNKSNSGWIFDRNTQTISGTYDGCVTSGFINPTNYYTNYYLTTKVNTGWDDDNLMIIVGYTVDSNGKEHTLSIVRGAGNIGGDDFNNSWLGYGPENGYHIDCKFWWGLIYDMGNDTQFIIEDKSGETGPSPFYTKETRNAIAYITAIRSDDKFEFRTSRFSSDGSDKEYVPEWNIYFQLPSVKPSTWSQEMYNNIKIMLTQTNRVGFGTRSGQPSFSIEKQVSIFDDEDIYALHTDTVYTWNPGKGAWVVKGKVHEILSNRVFIYYPRKNYLYFYLFWNSWTKMILNPADDIIKQIQEQIKNIQNITNNISNISTTGEQGQVLKVNATNKNFFADDNFYELNVFDNNNDIINFKNSFNYDINMKTIFDTWQSNRSMNRSLIDLGIWTDSSANNNFVQKNNKDGNWKYSDGYLVMGLNQSIYCTFISLSEYQANCSIEVLIQAIDVGDDDIVSIIFGYTEDDSNYYTLEYNATPNKQNQTIYSSTVTYNLAQNGCKLLLSQPLSAQFQNSNDRPFSKMKIEKRLNGITVYRSYYYSSEQECINAPYQYTGNYTYPSSKPSNWDDSTYKRIGKMFGQSKIGFGTISWNCKFKVLSSNISELIGNSFIYNLTNDNIEKYVNNNWILSTDKVSTVVPYRVLLYNSFTSKLFYYYYKNKYVYIK